MQLGKANAMLGNGGNAHLLDSSMAAPPTLKRQLGISMERSLPKYQFCVMFSVLTTRARLLGYTCTIQRAAVMRCPAYYLLRQCDQELRMLSRKKASAGAEYMRTQAAAN